MGITHETGVISSDQSSGPRYGNQATHRVLVVLAKFLDAQESRGVSELGRELGMNKNMVHRVVTTLVEAGYLVRDSTGERYQLGYRLLDLQVDDGPVDIRSLARPTLEQLHAFTGESVFLSIIVGVARVNVDYIEAQGRRVSLSQRGLSVPLHHTTMSHILLAHLSDEEVAAYLAEAEPLGRFNALFPDVAPTSVEAVWAEVRALRGRSHVIWRSPKQFDAAYVAFPIPGLDRRLHGVVTIGGPMDRFDPDSVVQQGPVMAALKRLKDHCAALTPVPVVVAHGTAA